MARAFGLGLLFGAGWVVGMFGSLLAVSHSIKTGG